MGFLQKLRSEFVDIVEWVDDSRHTIVWRFPRHHNQIKHGAKLIVRPGQQAIFVHRGRLADVFGPGTHRLETRNLPLLSTIAGWGHGFDSPFKAEVYFVATRQITELKWGTPNPVMMRDPDFGALRVRGFGTYTLRAADPRKLLTELVGTDSAFESEEIGELLRSIVSSSFADLLASSEIAVLDLASRYGELSERLRSTVEARVREEFGLELPQLWVVNISLPAEVEAALDARTSMSVVGDLAKYQQYQMGQSIPIAAANPAGGVAGAGAGLGLGLAAMQSLQPGAMAMAPGGWGAGSPAAAVAAPAAGPAAAPAASPPPAPPAVLWHIVEAGAAVGPLSVAQVTEAVVAGRVRGETLVWSAGMTGWLPAAQVPDVAAILRSRIPPPPPPA